MNRKKLIIDLIVEDLRRFQVMISIREFKIENFYYHNYGMLVIILGIMDEEEKLDDYDFGGVYREHLYEVKYMPKTYFGDHLRPLAKTCYKALKKRYVEVKNRPNPRNRSLIE